MCAVRIETDRSAARGQGRRGFLADVVAAVVALPFLQWEREAGAQVYYDQYGQPVTVAPGAVVTPAPPAPATAPPPGYSSYGPSGVVGQSRRVARRSSRRTGRREGLREDMWDEID
jgi:hypothetical protein